MWWYCIIVRLKKKLPIPTFTQQFKMSQVSTTISFQHQRPLIPARTRNVLVNCDITVNETSQIFSIQTLIVQKQRCVPSIILDTKSTYQYLLADQILLHFKITIQCSTNLKSILVHLQFQQVPSQGNSLGIHIKKKKGEREIPL